MSGFCHWSRNAEGWIPKIDIFFNGIVIVLRAFALLASSVVALHSSPPHHYNSNILCTMLRCLFSTKNAIESIGENPQEPDGTIKGEESDQAITKVPVSAMDIVGITGLGSSIATMVLTQGHVVDIASLSTMLLAPYAAFQKRQLKNLGGMRGQQNELRANVNFLYQQNNILYHSINKLGVQVHK